MNPISLAVPTFNRCNMVLNCIAAALTDDRVDEIVLCDDASADGSYEKLRELTAAHPKVKLVRNTHNLDCYGNKAEALSLAKNDWAILFDSDNTLGPDYIDRLFQLSTWDEECSYLPVFAQPHFDYREFEGLVVDRTNVAKHMGNGTFRTALNTANFFVHRKTYLDVWNPNVNPHTADSIYMNYRLLAAGKKLVFVPGLHYGHLVHPQSHYKLNCHKTGRFAQEVETKLKALK